jgi:zinc D-Ala-D-Ala carboxypeptidase
MKNTIKSLFLIAFFLQIACQSPQAPINVETAQSIPVQQTILQSQPENIITEKTDKKPQSIPKTIKKSLPTDELMGKFEPSTHPDFEKITAPYTEKAGMLLRKETLESFKKMHQAAQKEGISLKIISATRNFDRQKQIWEAKWALNAKEFPDATKRALKILEFSSMPSTSRHHWGTDMDLNDLNNESFEKGGKYEKAYLWLVAHAHEYGFCQPYSPKGKDRPNGYNEEKWHWTYLPLSKDFLAQYLENVKNTDLAGFKGAETAVGINAVEKYVGGINQACQN